jgi:peptidoglycan-associated lipoprotein
MNLLNKESIMPQSINLNAKKISLSLLAATLVFGAGCAAKPKVVPEIGANAPAASQASEAASTSRPSPTPQPATASTLPAIAPAQAFSDGAQAGLRPQASAMAGAGNIPQAAASLAQAGDRIFFMTDRFDLTEEAQAVLARKAAWINANRSKRVIIAGSADERGTREYNLALGSRRASAARDYLVSLGVNGNSVETVSYGKERPLDARSNPEGWAINRNSLTQLLD